MTNIYRREVCQREVILRNASKRNGIRLLDNNGVIAIVVLRRCIGKTHRHTRRHLEGGIGNSPLAHNTAILTSIDEVIHICCVNRVALASMRKAQRQGVVLGTLPVILTHSATRPIGYVCRGRGVDILGMYKLEVLLAVALLSRLQVGQIREWGFAVVEWHIVDTRGVGIVATCKDKVATLAAVKPVYRLRGLSKTTQSHIAHALTVEGVVDTPILQRGIQRRDVHSIEVAVYCPLPVVQGTYRVVEVVGLQSTLLALFLDICSISRLALLHTITRHIWVSRDARALSHTHTLTHTSAIATLQCTSIELGV